jgi:hypothetical protein
MPRHLFFLFPHHLASVVPTRFRPWRLQYIMYKTSNSYSYTPQISKTQVFSSLICVFSSLVCMRAPQTGKFASKLLQAQARSSLDLHLPTPSSVPPQCPVLVAIQIFGTLEEQRGLYNGGFGPHVRVVVCLMLCLHPVLAASSHMSPLRPLLFHRILPYTCGALYPFPPPSPSCPHPPLLLHILTTIARAKTPAVPSHRHYSRTTSNGCAPSCGRSSAHPRRHAHALPRAPCIGYSKCTYIFV